MKVHILGLRETTVPRHLHPIRTFASNLRDIGIEPTIYHDPSKAGIEECDVLIFMEASYRKLLPINSKDRSSALEFLIPFFAQFERVIWFDDRDSSGMIRTYVMPFIYKYAKSQILKCKEYYNEFHITGDLHQDFVNEQYGIKAKQNYKGPIGDAGIDKMRMGWNLALNDHFLRSQSALMKKWRLYFPSTRNKFLMHKPQLHERPIQLSYRANMWDSIPPVNWWRKTTLKRVEAFAQKNPLFDIRCQGKVAYKDYLREMENTVVVPSPFGLGEICYRDFEAFLSGAVLLKPSMDHLETWPSLYEDGVTYVAHRWDFADFEEKLADIVFNPQRYEDIAQEGQKRLVDALTNGPAFAEQFRKMIADPQSRQ